MDALGPNVYVYSVQYPHFFGEPGIWGKYRNLVVNCATNLDVYEVRAQLKQVLEAHRPLH